MFWSPVRKTTDAFAVIGKDGTKPGRRPTNSKCERKDAGTDCSPG